MAPFIKYDIETVVDIEQLIFVLLCWKSPAAETYLFFFSFFSSDARVGQVSLILNPQPAVTFYNPKATQGHFSALQEEGLRKAMFPEL